MKRRVMIAPESDSLLVKPIRYSIVFPPAAFVRTDIMTVFPDLHALCKADRLKEEGERAAAAGSSSSENDLVEAAAAAAPAPLQPMSPNGDGTKAVFVISTFQPCEIDGLVTFNQGSAEFKDVSRDRFFDFIRNVEARLGIVRGGAAAAEHGAAAPKSKSKWYVDYPDPATGVPVHGHGTSSVFCESDAIEQLLKMELLYVHGCRMIVHPKFGENVYPASAVVYGGTADELVELLQGI